MANSVYGTKKPAQITSDDVDIYYFYRPSYGSESTDFKAFKKLDSTILTTTQVNYDGSNQNGVTLDLPGMYNLRLPLDKFSKKGIYTIYIKPKETFTKIIDVSTLAAYSNVRGIVLDATDIKGLNSANGELVGYRVEYFNSDGQTRSGEFRIITSNNKCEPVTQNFNDSSQKGVRYRFNDSSNLIFCTLSPSMSLSYKSDSVPNIGTTTQRIALINTKFNPVSFDIEMVEHDIETVSTMLEGAQIRDLNNGFITTFNEDGGIYHQAEYGNITNVETGINHDFKVPKKNDIRFIEEDRLKEIEENI